MLRRLWGWTLLDQLCQDVRYALRGMRRSPGFTSVAILSLALGIGANTAIFSLMYTVTLRSLPVSHPEQLVELLQQYPREPRMNAWSRSSYEHYRDHARAFFSAITGAALQNNARLEIEGSEPASGAAEYVLENYFPELGLQPALGRLIGPADEPCHHWISVDAETTSSKPSPSRSSTATPPLPSPPASACEGPHPVAEPRPQTRPPPA